MKTQGRYATMLGRAVRAGASSSSRCVRCGGRVACCAVPATDVGARRRSQMNLVDTSGWLEPLRRHAFRKALCRNRERYADRSQSIIYEVFKKVRTQLGRQAFVAVAPAQAGRRRSGGWAVALLAAKLSSDHKLPMADALIYATAQLRGATVYNQDAHFRNCRVSGISKANDVLPS